MGRQFLDIEAKHLDIQAEHIQERTVVGRRAEHVPFDNEPAVEQRGHYLQQRVMHRPIMAVERPENTSYHSNEPVQIPTSTMTTIKTMEIYPMPGPRTRTMRTPHKVGRRHCQVTILFRNQNRCGSHIICNNTTMKLRRSKNSDIWVRSE